MELRGSRECRDCGTQWSYFETESITCPDCGSPRSTAVDDGAVHTGSEADLDLADARAAIDDQPIARVGELAASAARSYRQSVGFVAGGELRALDDEYVLAAELETVGSRLARRLEITDDEEAHLLALLRASVDGERPGPAAVPASLQASRGLAISRAVADYRRDVRDYLGGLDEDPLDGELASSLSAIRARRKRVDALDGNVDPREAERLLAAVRDLYAYLDRDDEAALVRIRERLDDSR
jgi:hypothetical protein